MIASHSSSLDEDGFVVTDLLGPDAVAALVDLWASLDLDEEVGFYATSAHGARDMARRVDQEIKRIVADAVACRLPDHKPFLGSFLVKGATGHNWVDLHQDWIYAEEPPHRSIVAWCPLVGMGPEDGVLHVVPGSHRWLQRPRGSGPLPDLFGPRQARLWPHAVGTGLDAGSAVVYDAAALHGSPPNDGARTRLAVGIALAPAQARLLHVHSVDGVTGDVYEIDEAYYTIAPFASRPAGYTHLGAVDVSAPLSVELEIDRRIDALG